MLHFYTPWEHQKTRGFLFLGGTEVEHWLKGGIGVEHWLKIGLNE